MLNSLLLVGSFLVLLLVGCWTFSHWAHPRPPRYVPPVTQTNLPKVPPGPARRPPPPPPPPIAAPHCCVSPAELSAAVVAELARQGGPRLHHCPGCQCGNDVDPKLGHI